MVTTILLLSLSAAQIDLEISSFSNYNKCYRLMGLSVRLNAKERKQKEATFINCTHRKETKKKRLNCILRPANVLVCTSSYEHSGH